MSRHTRAASTGPFLTALAALFALCLTAPRAWEKAAHEYSLKLSLANLAAQGEPTLAPPKKKRQVVVGQQATETAANVPLPAEHFQVGRLELQRLPTVDMQSPLLNGSASHNDETRPLSPIVAYPEARVANQPVAVAHSANSGLVNSMIVETTEAATRVARQIPAMTGPVRDLVQKFTHVIEQDPLGLAASELGAGEPKVVTRSATVTTASRPNRTQLELPKTNREVSGAPALTMPATNAQPEANQGAGGQLVAVGTWWPLPVELMNHLEHLRWTAEAGAWAMDTKVLLEELNRQSDPRAPRSAEILAELNESLSQLNLLMPALEQMPVGDELRRTGYALSRRLDLWGIALELVNPNSVLVGQPDPNRLNQCIAELAAVTQSNRKGNEWRDYLLLDALSELAAHRENVKTEQQQALAQRVLSRLDSGGWKAWQQQFTSTAPLASLRQELRCWNHEQIDPRQLFAEIEQFESSPTSSHARAISASYRALVRSPQPVELQLARQIETHYRNANLRLTFTDSLVNRLMPHQRAHSGQVNETMMGLPTRGWSQTNTHIQVRFIPDPTRVRMALEAQGKIFSQTYTASGPVTVYSDSDSFFAAAKELRMNLDGFEAGATEVSADSHPRLKKIQTKLDPVPFLRSIVQGFARSQYDESQPEAKAEARRKISKEVQTHMDEEIAGYILNGNVFFKERVIEPLTELGLSPQLIESQTTRDRCTMRLRIAAGDQLAGHGPRPRAPSNSLASMQMHESVLNNLCQQLGWEGKTYTLPQLREQAHKLLRLDVDLPEDENLNDLFLTFAPSNAVQVYCRDGQLQVNLAFAKLRKAKQTWKDFTVRVHYRPDLSQPGAPLHRDGTVQLIGDRLNTGAQIALRGIFSKAFPPSRTFKLIPDKLIAAKPGLSDIVVTQCDLRDGWLGIALAADPTVRQTKQPEKTHPQPLRSALLPLLRR